MHKRTSRLLPGVILALVLLTACGPAIVPQPLPTPQIVDVQVTSAIDPLADLLTSCIEAQPNAAIVLSRLPANALNPQEAAVALRWGAGDLPASSFAAVLGEEQLVIITHPENPIRTITLEELRSIYLGEARQWAGTGNEVHPYIYPAGEDTQLVFENAVLAGELAPAGVTYLAPDPAAVIEAVSGDPFAVGFLPERWMNDQVAAVEIEGIDRELALEPVLAISAAEPTGVVRSWLLCLQDKIRE